MSSASYFSQSSGNQPELDFGGRHSPDSQGFAVSGRVTKGKAVVRKIDAAPAA